MAYCQYQVLDGYNIISHHVAYSLYIYGPKAILWTTTSGAHVTAFLMWRLGIYSSLARYWRRVFMHLKDFHAICWMPPDWKPSGNAIYFSTPFIICYSWWICWWLTWSLFTLLLLLFILINTPQLLWWESKKKDEIDFCSVVLTCTAI